MLFLDYGVVEVVVTIGTTYGTKIHDENPNPNGVEVRLLSEKQIPFY